ncbi:hypothetical protein BC828DRAFT_409196 [Blastocladiella britannica]|nr:hypothetical protein BC828DRAFT_409196 [Blastocladiella britannica]
MTAMSTGADDAVDACAYQPLPTGTTNSTAPPRFAIYKLGYLPLSFNYFVADAELDYPWRDARKVGPATAAELLAAVFGRPSRPTGSVWIPNVVVRILGGDANSAAFTEATRLVKPNQLGSLAAAHAAEARRELDLILTLDRVTCCTARSGACPGPNLRYGCLGSAT